MLGKEFLNYSKDILEICKPLKQLHLSYFSYTLCKKDGGRIYLTNFPQRLEHYLEKKEYLTGNLESNPENYSPQVISWATLPNQSVIDVCRKMNLDHGIFIIKPFQEYTEYYGFGTNKNNYSIINTYLTNIDLLDQFTGYFKDKAASIMTEVKKHSIILPFTANNLIAKPDLQAVNGLKNKLTNRQSVKKIQKLTVRQRDCAKLLMEGKSIRVIAEILNLSPRTVETYINNIKIKLNCANKIELIRKLTEILYP